MNVIAVVVTYNRSELLKKVLECLCAQSRKPKSIIVVDNASTDDTAKVISEKKLSTDIKIMHIKLETNLGGAGGFYHGMVAAYKSNAEYIWLMDDDCMPTPTALEALQNCAIKSDNSIGFLSSYVAYKDGNTCISNVPGPHPSWLSDFSDKNNNINRVRLGWATFVSCFVSREAISKVGFPVKEFFIWGDDVEYTGRVSSKFNCYFVPESIVHHHTSENKSNTYNYVNEKTIWKFKYAMRNIVAYIRYTQPLGIIRAISYWRGAYSEMRIGNVPIKYRIILFFQWCRGITFNYKKFIVMPDRV